MKDRLNNKYLKSELKVYGVYRGDLKRPLPKGWIERMGEIHSAHVRMLANENEMSHVVLKRWQEVYSTAPKKPGDRLAERKIAISANGLPEIVRKWQMWYSKRCFLSILPETSFPLLLTGFLLDF